MEEILLNAELRPELRRVKVNQLRKKGFIPAVIYGEKKDSQAVSISHKELLGLIRKHRLENTLINLVIKGDKKRPCLIKEIQYEPVHDNILHVDFNEISLTKTIKTSVPITAVGEAVGVKQEGGVLEHILWEIEIGCFPIDIPQDIKVDITNLKIGDSVHIKDIALPPKVKVLNNPDLMVLAVSVPVKEEVPAEAAVEAEEAKEPEVIKEKKEIPAEGATETKEKEKDKDKK